jgi:uncharacterized 2Fe-2S/4Fe-4S cluster protein (DUF4445 family)
MRIIINGRTHDVTAGQDENLFELMNRMGFRLDAPCGGGGRCGKCRVTIVNAGRPTQEEIESIDPESIREGIRLACATAVYDGIDVRFEPPSERLAHIATAGDSVQYDFDPAVKEVEVTLSPPQLSDQTADLERLCAALGVKTLRPAREALRALPGALRQGGWKPSAVIREDMLLGLNPKKLCGVAVDVGTTTLACYLLDLRGGIDLAVASALNPQRAFGDDVISRCDYARSGGLDELQKLVSAEINRLVGSMCAQAGVDREDVFQMTVAGNTVMMHLLAGISPENIAQSPFIPAWTHSVDFRAAELGLKLNRSAVVSLLPCIAGYVGADTAAAMLAAGMREGGEPVLLIDIGTNGEIALSANGRLFACSTAAGPAFEGAHISCGMGGVGGAISQVKVDGGIRYRTIGNAVAVGICGSGLLDLVAGFLDVGAIDETGRIDADKVPPWMEIVEGKLAVDKARGIFVTQRDVREVQLAKGAIAAGVEVLLREAGIGVSDIRHVYLAGGFGSFMDKRSAGRIGLIPPELVHRTSAMGNGSGAGAKAALLSKAAMTEAERLARAVRYVELSVRQDFQDAFVDKMMFY